jgi:hypothetical protein
MEGNSGELPDRAGNPQHRRNRSEEERKIGRKLNRLLVEIDIISPRKRIENRSS